MIVGPVGCLIVSAELFVSTFIESLSQSEIILGGVIFLSSFFLFSLFSGDCLSDKVLFLGPVTSWLIIVLESGSSGGFSSVP